MRDLKNKKPSTICVDEYRGSGDHHEVRGRLHGHRRRLSSTEGMKRSLTDDDGISGIEYCRDSSRRKDTSLTTAKVVIPLVVKTLVASTTNGLDVSTEYHLNDIHHRDYDDFYLESSSDNSDANTDSIIDDETSNKDW